MPKAGFTEILPADGAFYLYADVRHLTNDSAGFAKRMLEETGVAATPGVDFDAGRGSHYLRFCYAGTTKRMAEAVGLLSPANALDTNKFDRLRWNVGVNANALATQRLSLFASLVVTGDDQIFAHLRSACSGSM